MAYTKKRCGKVTLGCGGGKEEGGKIRLGGVGAVRRASDSAGQCFKSLKQQFNL